MQTSSGSNPGLWWGNTITFHKRTEQPQCVHTPAMLAKTRIRQETTIKIAVKGINHLSHLLKGIFVNARGARQAVGQIMLLKPSPKWNARTAHWRLTPIRTQASPRGLAAGRQFHPGRYLRGQILRGLANIEYDAF